MIGFFFLMIRRPPRSNHLPYTTHLRSRLQQPSQIVESEGDFGMVRFEALLVDDQRPPYQGFSFPQTVSRLQQPSQIVEVRGDLGMVRSEALLVDSQRPPHQRFGLLQTVRLLEQIG